MPITSPKPSLKNPHTSEEASAVTLTCSSVCVTVNVEVATGWHRVPPAPVLYGADVSSGFVGMAALALLWTCSVLLDCGATQKLRQCYT